MKLKAIIHKFRERFKATNPRFSLRAPLDRTFIFPNTFGFLFGGIAFVLLLMSMGYSNNLLYFYVFFLISVAIVGMWVTNHNLDRVKMRGVHVSDLFANEKGYLHLGLGVDARVSKNPVLKFLFPSAEAYMVEVKTVETSQWPKSDSVQIELLKEDQARIPCQPPRRGLFQLPRFEVESVFPFSMLIAWKYEQADESVYIYPQRFGSREIPSLQSASEDERRALENELNEDDTGLFSHHREFQNNDPVYRIDWKRSAKFDQLLVKKFEENRSHKQVLSWGMTADLKDTEFRLSQMSLWVDLCEKSGFEYKLMMPELNTPFAQGEDHYRMCMRHLATFALAERERSFQDARTT